MKTHPPHGSPNSPVPSQPVPLPQPALAASERSDPAVVSPEIGRLLGRIVADESALYAVTRKWRADAAQRNFGRLHALLDEQFSGMGARLVHIARRSRVLDGSRCPWGRARPARAKAITDDRVRQHEMIRELLALHEALLTRLSAGTVIAADDRNTHELLAELTANHEKDAFMLRAMLWEVQNNPA